MTDLPPDGFKMTPLGPLPEEWDVVRLGDLLSRRALWVQNGFAQGEHNQAGLGVMHLRPFNVTTVGTIDLTQAKYVALPPVGSRYWVQPGDIIFNNTNSEDLVGKTAYFSLSGQFVLSNHMTILRVLDAALLDAYWLAQQLSLRWQEGLFRALCRRHVNQASISLARLESVAIPLPPLPEQRAIAHVLQTVQRAREATERVIAATRALKRSLMRHLFAYGPVPLHEADRVPLKETEIGPLPAHWEAVRLGEVARELFSGGTPSTRIAEYWGGDIPWTTSAHIEGLYLTRGAKTITSQGLANSSSRVVPQYNVIVGTRVGVGKVAVNLIDIAISQDLTGIIIDKQRAHLEFLAYVLLSEQSQRVFRSSTRGTTIKGIPRDDLVQIPIPLPPLPEQQALAAALLAVDCKLQAEENRNQSLDALFKTLLRHLMTGKVRVVPKR